MRMTGRLSEKKVGGVTNRKSKQVNLDHIEKKNFRTLKPVICPGEQGKRSEAGKDTSAEAGTVSRSRGPSSQGEFAVWTERVSAGVEGAGRSGAGHVASWHPQCERRESHPNSLPL